MQPTRKRRHDRRRALSLVEMVVSIMLVGIMLVAALGTVGLTQRTRYLAANRQRACRLARALLAEILEQDYADAAEMATLQANVLGLGLTVSVSLGLETGEDTGTRAGFDDLDDYHAWTASPPQEKDGTVLSNLNGWTRTVQVALVKHDDPRSSNTEDDGLKQITVTVQYMGETLAELVSFRALQLPNTEACCLPDGATLDMEPSVCLGYGGVLGGTGSTSLNYSCAEAPEPIRVVYEGFTEQKEDDEPERIRLNKPSGTENGDLLIAAVALNEADDWPSAPYGWTHLYSAEEDDVLLAVWMRVAGSWEGSSYTFRFDEAECAYGWMMRFSDADPDDPIHKSSGRKGTSKLPPVDAVTTTLDNTLILRLGAFKESDIIVDDTGLSGHEEITMDSGGRVSGGAGFFELETAGSSNTESFSLTKKRDYVTLTIAIAPKQN